jgi:Mrp family chromosome partitioning ATPase
LALSLASQPKQSVFLVDLDLRRHALASYLGLEQHSHLLSFLRRQESLDQALVLLEDKPLYMLLNDTSVETSSEMLSSDDAIEMVQQLKELGGIVIYDLPPLFAADDFLAFSVLVDCALLVVAEGQTVRDDVAKAKEQLANIDLVGVVLNKSADAVEGYY